MLMEFYIVSIYHQGHQYRFRLDVFAGNQSMDLYISKDFAGCVLY